MGAGKVYQLMNEKLRHSIRKIGKITQKIFGGLILAVLITFWFLISGFNLYCATNFHACNADSLTWWSMFLSVFGLPILAVQMYLLRKTFEEGAWKPEISVGIFFTTPEPDDVMKLDELPKKATIHYDDNFNVDFRNRYYDDPISRNFEIVSKIVIRNNGKAAAKNVKIQVSLIEYPKQPLTPELIIEKFGEISITNVLVANLENMIHPGDFHEFRFFIDSHIYDHPNEMTKIIDSCDIYLNPYGDKSKSGESATLIGLAYRFSQKFVVGKNIFQVKVWADGINPVSEKIILEIADFPNELKNLIKATTLELEKVYTQQGQEIPKHYRS